MSEAVAGEAGSSKSGQGGLGLLRNASLAASLALVVVGAATLGAGPLLYRMGVLDLPGSTAGVENWAMLIFAAGVAFALLALVVSLVAKKHRGAILAVLFLAAAGTGAGTLYGQSVLRADLPPLHDVQTDWSQPVAFSEATLRAREAAGAARIRDDATFPESESKWSGRSFADAQREVYDLKPITVKASAPDATVAAEKVAERLGWSVMLSDPPNGQLEAVHYSFWYGLASDIAVRITPADGGSRVDIRSASRIAGGDGGANAGQVKEFLDELSFALR
jgi:Protein of unknown function (DUF1499)